MKLHPSYIADLQTLTPLDNLWLKSSVPMFMDTACTLPVDNPCSLEVITLADIRFKDNPTLTVIDSKGNELYVTQPILVEDSFASNAPAPIDTTNTTGYFKRLRVNSTNEDTIDIRTAGSIAADQTIYAQTFTTGGQNVTATAISNWNNHLTNTSNPHSTTFAQLGSKPTTLSGFGITDAINQSEKGVALGVVPLDSGAKISTAYLPASIVGQVHYNSTWNASTNNPTLPSATTDKGGYYIVSVAGTYNSIDFNIGDWVISDGTNWGKVDNTDSISSWNGRTGAILPLKSDYSAWFLDNSIYGNINTWTAKQNFADTSAYGYGSYTLWGNSGNDRVIDVRKKTDNNARIALYENGTLLFGDGAGGTLGTLNGVTAGLNTDGNLTVGGTLISTYCAQFTNAWIGTNSADNQVDTVGMRNTAIASAVAGYSPTSHTHTFASLTSKPTTLAGYGITDAVNTTNGVVGVTIVNASAFTSSFCQDIFGTTSQGSYLREIRTQATAPASLLGNYSSGIAWKGADTYGSLMVSYDSANIRVSGGNGTNPVWVVDLYHTGNFNPANYSLSTHTHTFASLTSKPTTLSGYGITDAVGSSDSRLSDARTPNNNAAIVQGSVNNSGAYGKRTTALGNTALAVEGLLDSGFYDANGTGTPLGNWTHIINSAHNNSYSGNQYQFQFAASFDNSISTLLNSGSGNWGGEGYWVRTINTSGKGAWRKLWHSGNLIGDQGTTHTHDQYLTTASASSTYLPLAGGSLNSGATLYTAKDVSPSTTNTNNRYASAGLVIQRATNDTSTSTVAGIGFRNSGAGYAACSLFYLDPADGNFKQNTGVGAINTFWHSGNLVGNQGTTHTHDQYLTTATASSTYATKATTLAGYGITDAASSTHTHTQIEISNINEIVVGNGFNDVTGKLYVNWRGAGTNRISDYMLCDGKGAGVFSYITAAGFKLNGGTGDNLLSDNGSSVAVSSFALAGHNHNSTYAPLVHNHDSAYFKLNPASTQTVSGAYTIFTSPIEARGSSLFVGDVALSDGAYTNAALEVARSTNNSTYHAGIGFHNVGINAAYLYYSNSTNKFRFRRHIPDDFGLWDSSDFTSTNIGQWNTAWSRVASGRLCEDAYTGEDTLDWITRMGRGNHWGRIHGVNSAPSYFNYMLIRETTGTKYSVIGCASDGNWYVGASASNVNLTSYAKIWTSADFSSTAVNRINNSDSNYGFSRLYRADDQSKYYLKHRWTTGGWNGNSWRLECANDHADSQSGIFTVVTNYADVGNTAYTLTSKGGSNYGANLDTGFMGNTCGLWAGSVDSPTGSTPFGQTWTWMQEWGHADGNWRAQLATPYFSDNLAWRRKNNGTWMAWRYVVSTNSSGQITNSLSLQGGNTFTVDGWLLANNTVKYTVGGSDLTGAGPYDIGDTHRNVIACPIATTLILQSSSYAYHKIVHAIGGTVTIKAVSDTAIKRGSGGSSTYYNIGAGATAICGYTPGFGYYFGFLY